MCPNDRKYTKTHEWVKLAGEDVVVGITDFAVQELCSGNEGDLVYCDLPEPGRTIEAGETFGEIESVKAVSDLYAPVAGEIVAVNDKVVSEPGLVNAEPTGNGWLFKMKVGNSTELNALLDEEAYKALTE